MKKRNSFIMVCDDYHSIDVVKDIMNKTNVLGEKVKSVELGFYEPNYIGLFWIGIKPEKEEIRKLLKEHKFTKKYCDEFLKYF